jgi:hypothetical protein
MQNSAERSVAERRLIRVVAGCLAVVVGCGGDGTGPKHSPGLRIVSGGSAVDSIGSLLREPLTVIVADANGKPVAGEVVSFSVSSANSAYLARDASSDLRDALVATTDADGRASVRVHFGLSVGPAPVVARVSALGFADTAQYTVTPGAPARIALSPRDTVAYVGTSFTMRASTTDRADNVVSTGAPTLSLASGPGRIGPAEGVVTTTDFGRVAIAARAGLLAETAWVSVVPRAWVAAQEHISGNGGPIGIFLMQLDGSGRTQIAAGLGNAWGPAQGFGWSPDGRSLAIARGDSVDLVTPGSPERRLVGGRGAVLLGARFSRDGQWIYFARAATGIFRVHPDGTGEEHIGYGGTQFGEDFRPTPSPDGREVAYGSSRSPCGVDDCIRVLDMATGAERVLVTGTNAAWSPTSDVIAYASRAGVGLIRADGTGQQLLAPDVRNVGWMDWSPDGRWLLVSPGVGPVILFDTTNGMRLPLATFTSYGATAWRQDASLATAP